METTTEYRTRIEGARRITSFIDEFLTNNKLTVKQTRSFVHKISALPTIVLGQVLREAELLTFYFETHGEFIAIISKEGTIWRDEKYFPKKETEE